MTSSVPQSARPALLDFIQKLYSTSSGNQRPNTANSPRVQPCFSDEVFLLNLIRIVQDSQLHLFREASVMLALVTALRLHYSSSARLGVDRNRESRLIDNEAATQFQQAADIRVWFFLTIESRQLQVIEHLPVPQVLT